MKEKNKYRGKRIDNDEWVYGYYLRDTKTDCNYIVVEVDWDCEVTKHNELYYSVEQETVGQYTGIEDGQATPTYEDDFVKLILFYPTDERLKELDQEFGTVKMLEGQWVIEFENTAIPLWSEEYTYKIMGSIHDVR